MRVKCLAQEHNTMSPARAPTRTARSRDERAYHEATAPTYLNRNRTNKMYREEVARILLRICVVEVNSVLPKVLHSDKLASRETLTTARIHDLVTNTKFESRIIGY